LPVLLVVSLLVLTATFFSETAGAHKLEMDLLSVRFDSNSQVFTGQLLVDPLTSRGSEGPIAEGSSLEAEHARVLLFAKDHVTMYAGSQVLELSLEVRELYAKGGAVPGDSVIFSGRLPGDWQEVSVRIAAPMSDLAVTASVDNVEKPAVLMTPEHALVIHQAAANTESAGENPSVPEAKANEPAHFSQFIRHIGTGFVHIIPLGWDHILFVLALTLGSIGKWRRLVFELSAFTIAHTLTFGLASLELVRVAPSIVEPLIAFSISAAAIEYLVDLERKEFRYALVVSFGLLHGLGFAGALLGLGLSKTSFLAFLVSFNLGVELGQLTVVAASLALLWLVRRWPEKRKLLCGVLAGAIAVGGMILGVTRLIA